MADSPRPIQTLADLIPDDRNPNLGTARGHAMLRDSLQKFGAGRSILVDKHGKIIAGNKTAMEAFAAGLEDVVVVQTRGDKLVVVQREDLDLDADERARLLSIADNRAGEVGLAWDTTLLAELVESDELDLSDLFYDDELAHLVSGNGHLNGSGGVAGHDDPEGDEPPSGDVHDPQAFGADLPAAKVTIDDPAITVEKGDVWEVGPHILACFDIVREWHMWAPMIEPGMLLVPYPGPMVAFSKQVKERGDRLFLVQPDTYVAGHLIDLYARVNPDDHVAKR